VGGQVLRGISAGRRVRASGLSHVIMAEPPVGPPPGAPAAAPAQAPPLSAASDVSSIKNVSFERGKRRTALTTRLKLVTDGKLKAAGGNERPPAEFRPDPRDLFVPDGTKAIEWACYFKHCDYPHFIYCRCCHAWFKHSMGGGTAIMKEHIARCPSTFVSAAQTFAAAKKAGEVCPSRCSGV
jgi:hypothetical protein